MQGEGHISMFGTLQIGHTTHEGHQRLQCWPFANMAYHGYNSEDFVFTRPSGVERFVLGGRTVCAAEIVLSPDNVWYGKLKLLFTMSVKIDGQEEPVDIGCAYFSFCYKIKLEPSGTY